MVVSGFKVIVVGGGPVGLTAAHGLERAGIDFLLLEQRPNAVLDTGSNLVLLPNGIQALAELGFLADLQAVSTPLTHTDRLDHKAHDLGGLEFFEMMNKQSGMYPRVISRHDLTKVLYHKLSEESKTKILTNKRLQRIESTSDGITVTCKDGSKYSATTMLGADGAHSQVRSEMRSLALEYGSSGVNPEQPYLTTFQAIWIRMPAHKRVKPGMTCETHGSGGTTQFFSGEDSAVVGLYERLPEPTRERMRFTLADEESIVKRWEHVPLIPDGTLTLGEMYRLRTDAGLISLEEGVVDYWSWAGRIVLAGDAAHKFTPSTGQGCNTGIIDVLTLTDEMHHAFRAARASTGDPAAVPPRTEIVKAFLRYQDIRIVTARSKCDRSGRATASATWSSTVSRFLDCHVISLPAIQKWIGGNGTKSAATPQRFAFLHRSDSAASTEGH